MFCKNCGAQNADGTKFCTSCGSPLEQPAGYNNNNASQNTNQYDNAQQQFNYQQNGGMNPPPNASYMPFMGIPERNIVTCILLSIITCGIYELYWLYQLTEDTNKISGNPNATSGGMVILFWIITCGLYGLYWMYKRGEFIDNYHMQRGMPGGSNSILYLVLDIFGLGIVSVCLMQNELNKISKGF